MVSLEVLYKQFTQSLKTIYDSAEAHNIWKLAAENVMGSAIGFTNQATKHADEVQTCRLLGILDRLLLHEPIQYIINECWFYDIPFYVNNNVLIPRPETEELVDWVIRDNHSNPQPLILDVGTGSGCIPVILKRKIPAATVYSCDISHKALQVAQRNAAAHHTPINFLHIDFLNGENHQLIPSADIIVSNPPYIPESDRTAMCKNVLQYEPHIALFVANSNPLIFYEAIARFGTKKLQKGGVVYVETHEDLAEKVTLLFQSKNYKTFLKKDMQGKYRMVKAVL